MKEFNPNEPFIAKDGLEYACAADYLLQNPIDCWRNQNIQQARQAGTNEETIRRWIEAFDGEDKTPSCTIDPSGEIAKRHNRANFAVDPRGVRLEFRF